MQKIDQIIVFSNYFASNIDIIFRMCYIFIRVEAVICGPGLVARPRWEGGLQGANCETGHRSVSFGLTAKHDSKHHKTIDRGGLVDLGWEIFGFECCARNQYR